MKSGILLLLLAAPLLLWAKPTPATEKAGYCSRQPPLGGVFDEEPCSACLKDQSCSNCSSDADCPGEAKCCPGDCGFTCQAPVKDFCHLPSVCGSCKALFVRFFYNSSTRACEEFVYGGCGGNKNNFETKEDCSKACQHLDTA